jgi:hypothetical protein
MAPADPGEDDEFSDSGRLPVGASLLAILGGSVAGWGAIAILALGIRAALNAV